MIFDHLPGDGLRLDDLSMHPGTGTGRRGLGGFVEGRQARHVVARAGHQVNVTPGVASPTTSHGHCGRRRRRAAVLRQIALLNLPSVGEKKAHEQPQRGSSASAVWPQETSSGPWSRFGREPSKGRVESKRFVTSVTRIGSEG